jgi:hypothetical protein
MQPRTISAASAAALASVLALALAPAPALAKFGRQFTLSGPASGGAQVATNARGDTIVVWHVNGDDTHTASIRARVRPAGGDFGPIELVRRAEPASAGLSDPKVAIDGQGNAVIVWSNHDANGGLDSHIEESFRSADGTYDFGLITPVSCDDAPKNTKCEFGDNPQVAMNAAGAAVIAYDGAIAPNSDPFPHALNLAEIAVSPGGGGFSFPEAVNIVRSQTIGARDTRAAIDASGNVLVVWHSFPDTGPQQILARTLALEPPKVITSYSSGQSPAQLAMDGAGNAIVVWSGPSGVFERSRSAAGVWERTKTLATGGMGESTVAIDANATDAQGNAVAGNAVVAWVGGNPFVGAARIRAAGGKFGRAKVFSDGADFSTRHVQAAIAGDNVVVSWTILGIPPLGPAVVQAVTGSTTGSFKRLQNLSPDGQTSEFPDAAIDPAGNATVVWQNSTKGSHVQGADSLAKP